MIAFTQHTIMTRLDIEDWLAEKTKAQEKQNQLTLLWAKIAGWSGIIGALVGLAGARSSGYSTHEVSAPSGARTHGVRAFQCFPDFT